MPPTPRQHPPTGPALDKQLDDAFGTEADAAAALEKTLQNPQRIGSSPPPLQVIGPFESPLYAALAQLQAEVPAIPKSKIARVVPKDKPAYSYKYADLADVTAIVLPLLGRLGLSWTCIPTWTTLPGETQARFVMIYRLRHALGEEITGHWVLPDRTDPHAIGSALTYYRRYALCAVTGVAADEDTDGTAAHQAASRTETLDDTSRLSLPPDEAAEIVAALEPGALTPLARYPVLWQLVVRRRATEKPVPEEVQEMMGALDVDTYMWGDFFGWSLAMRVDRLATPERCREFWDEAAACEKAGQPLPWTWEGKKSGTRLKERIADIAATEQRVGERLRQAIADAATQEEVDAVREAINAAHEAWEIHGLAAELYDLANEREGTLRGAAEPPVDTPAQLDEPGHPLHFGETAALLEYRIWAGAPTTTAAADIDAALERGLVDAEEARMLHGTLHGRPEPIDEAGEGLMPWLEWRIATARGHDQLDAVRDRVMEHVAKGRLTGGAADAPAQLLYNQIAARRKVQDGHRYGGDRA